MRTSITAGELARMLARIEPFISTDDTLPMLNAIRFDADADHLFAVGTDRYTLAVARTSATNDGPWRANLRLDDVPAAKAWVNHIDPGEMVRLGSARRGDISALTFRQGTQVLRTVTKVKHEDQFPAWRQIVREAIERPLESVPLTGFNPRYLARFQQVQAPHGLHAWQSHPRKPLVLATNDGFLGMVMPTLQETKTRDDIVTEWCGAMARKSATVNDTAYDLTVGWRDRQGDPWEYAGRDSERGEPLMELVGLADDPWPLRRVIAEFGPLTEA